MTAYLHRFNPPKSPPIDVWQAIPSRTPSSSGSEMDPMDNKESQTDKELAVAASELVPRDSSREMPEGGATVQQSSTPPHSIGPVSDTAPLETQAQANQNFRFVQVVDSYDLAIVQLPVRQESSLRSEEYPKAEEPDQEPDQEHVTMVLLVSKEMLTMLAPTLLKAAVPYSLQQDVVFLKSYRRVNPPISLDCDRRALIVIVGILHFRHIKSAFELNWEVCVEVAALCEKYQLQGPLTPWAYIWYTRHSGSLLKPGFEDWLYFSHVFHYKVDVEELIELLSVECGMPDSLPLATVKRMGEVINTSRWPSALKADVFERRRAKIESIRQHLRDLLQQIQSASINEIDLLCRNVYCLNLAHGSLVSSCYQLGLMDLVNYGQWLESVMTLRERVGKLDFRTLNKVKQSHDCSLKRYLEEAQTAIQEEGES